MKAKQVSPQKWLWDVNYPIRVLYDDDEYSIIWGKYENIEAMGVRWSGGVDNIGYPGQGGYPTWYIEPDFIAITIVQRLLNLAIDNIDYEYLDNINFAMQKLTIKMTAK